MQLCLLSDIHLELVTTGMKYMRKFIPSHPLPNTVLILAGDIGNPTAKLYKRFVIEIAKYYDKVFIVTGNHEYYQSARKIFDHSSRHVVRGAQYTMDLVDANIRDFVATLTNVHFLQRDSFIYNRVRFLGCTLWTISDPALTSQMNDYSMIPCMTSDKCTALHNRDVEWLDQQLAIKSNDYDATVVITHHLPSFSITSSMYVGNPLNVFYASNLDHLVVKANIWLCGHSHTAKRLCIGACRCFVNPVGYVGEHTNYDVKLSIPITGAQAPDNDTGLCSVSSLEMGI